jgi:predicted cupin superfamily sugar epimerase
MQCYSADKVQLVLLDQQGRVAASSATFACRHSNAAQVFQLDDVWWVSEGHFNNNSQYIRKV